MSSSNKQKILIVDDEPDILDNETSVAWVADERVRSVCHKSVVFPEADRPTPALPQGQHTIMPEHAANYEGKAAGKESGGDWRGVKRA